MHLSQQAMFSEVKGMARKIDQLLHEKDKNRNIFALNQPNQLQKEVTTSTKRGRTSIRIVF